MIGMRFFTDLDLEDVGFRSQVNFAISTFRPMVRHYVESIFVVIHGVVNYLTIGPVAGSLTNIKDTKM